MAQLDVGDDLLASWMAHYVAQLIDATEKAPTEAKPAAQEVCAKAILELWRYRATLPDHVRPLVELEPAVRALASLDFERSDYRYHPEVLRDAISAATDEQSKNWLELAIGIDFVARLLIQSALRSAAHRAASTAAPWVELAAKAGADEGGENVIVEFVLGGDSEVRTDQDERVTVLRDRLSQVEAFIEQATSLANDLRAQLGADNVVKG